MSDPQPITDARDSGTECAHAGSLDGIVSLRRATFDAAVELLELVSQLHVCEPDQYMKENNECDACHATRVAVEMREQANSVISEPSALKPLKDKP